MSWNNMRRSNCKLCDGFGMVTILSENEEVTKSCNCVAGDKINLPKFKKFFDKLKYSTDIELTEKENEIYQKLINGKEIKELCPF